MPKRIIIVDDDKEIREIVAFVLTRYDCVVEMAANGQQLQQLLACQLPDLIILDVMMPGEDGYHICSGLRSNPQTCHIPIMIMTAHVEDIYQRLSKDLGASLHMTKPFHPMELVSGVQALLETNDRHYCDHSYSS